MSHYFTYYSPTSYSESADSTWYKPLIGTRKKFSNGTPANSYDRNTETQTDCTVAYNQTATVTFKDFQIQPIAEGFETYISSRLPDTIFLNSCPQNAFLDEFMVLRRIGFTHAVDGGNAADVEIKGSNFFEWSGEETFKSEHNMNLLRGFNIANTSYIHVDNIFNYTESKLLESSPQIECSITDNHDWSTSNTQVRMFEFGFIALIKIPIRRTYYTGKVGGWETYVTPEYNDIGILSMPVNAENGYDVYNYSRQILMGQESQILSEEVIDDTLEVKVAAIEGFDVIYTFKPIDYNITYNLNGNNPYTTSNPANPTTYTVESDAITLINPTRKGYTFKGWSGTGLTGDTNKTVTIPAGSTGNRTYTANWTENYIEFEYWSNNRTEDNKKFITWKASPSSFLNGTADNHYNFTVGGYTQTYPGYKPAILEGYTSGGYYNTKPDGSGAYSVHEDYNFYNYLELCDTYGVGYYEPASIIPIYCQWEPESLISYDTIFNYFDWYRNEIKPGHMSTIISQNETGFTIRSNSGTTDGYSNTSPLFNLAKERNSSGDMEVLKDYVIDVDVVGSGWELFIFFYDDNGSAALYPNGANHTNITKSGSIITIPSTATKATIRVDSNAANNEITFSNFRIYPAKYYYMRYTVPENERLDCGQWSAPINPTRINNFYKFKGWSKSPGLEGKAELLNTSGKLPDEIAGGNMTVFSQWDKQAPRIFIQEANKTGGKAAPIARLFDKPIRKAFIYTTDTNKWREC